MGFELLLRPDLGKKAYRLKCRFTVGAFPSERTLEKAKYQAAEMFVRDMRKQGWEYLDRYGFKMSGPFPAVQTTILPKRHEQQRWHMPSSELIAAIRAGYRPDRHVHSDNGGAVSSVPRLSETDAWDFELAAVFVHRTILTEVPDKEEEKEMLECQR